MVRFMTINIPGFSKESSNDFFCCFTVTSTKIRIIGKVSTPGPGKAPKIRLSQRG
jgi:hypothetical protein